MNKDQVAGTAEKLKGKVNEAVGTATNDPAQQVKGNVQQAKGEAQKQFGNAREDVKKSHS
ncbi:MAG: CsbD family protein [Burkholderiaceae bacterium]|nr:CsbD family protein [Burkholderiaceae bacterium]